MSQRLYEDDLRRLRSRAQLLDAEEVSNAEPAEVVSRLVGMQGQDLRAAGLSIRARSRSLTGADVVAAAADTPPSLILTWSLRGTRHLHHVDDVRWLLDLLGPAFARPGRRAKQLGIDGRLGEAAMEVLADTVTASGPLTRPEVKDLLAGHGVDPTGQAPIHVIRRAALAGIVCVVPRPDGEEQYVALDRQVPSGSGVEPEAPLGELARRYLAGHGPAARDDFAAWSGLPAKAVEEAWDTIRGEATELDAGGRAVWSISSRPRRRATPLRLLGAFDALVLGYADRSAHLDPARTRDVNAGGGLVRPVVAVDGRIVGTWKHERSAGRLRVRPFREFGHGERRQLEEEVAGVGQFLGATPVLEVTEVST